MRLAIVTGGSKGLGRAMCEAFLQREFEIVEFSRSAPTHYSVHADLSNPVECARVVSDAIRRIDKSELTEIIVINNAGTVEPIGPASRKSQQNLLVSLNINFTSAILVLSEIIAQCQDLECRKVIVNISSGAALRGYPGWSLYCAAKSGMENFIRSIALEQALQDKPFIPINIAPGVIDTELQANIRASSVEDFPDIERFIQRKLEGGLASPEKVAAAVCRILDLPDLKPGERYDVKDFGS